MARETTTTTPDVILTRAHARIVAACDSATDDNTYISTTSTELPPNPDEVMYELGFSPTMSFTSDGGGHFTGAGRNAMHVSTQLSVTIHSILQADEVGRDKEYLTHADRGVIQYMTEILNALAEHDLLDSSGNELLSHPLRPSQAHIPPKDDRSRGYVTILFDLEFDWYIPPTEP